MNKILFSLEAYTCGQSQKWRLQETRKSRSFQGLEPSKVSGSLTLIFLGFGALFQHKSLRLPENSKSAWTNLSAWGGSSSWLPISLGLSGLGSSGSPGSPLPLTWGGSSWLSSWGGFTYSKGVFYQQLFGGCSVFSVFRVDIMFAEVDSAPSLSWQKILEGHEEVPKVVEGLGGLRVDWWTAETPWIAPVHWEFWVVLCRVITWDIKEITVKCEFEYTVKYWSPSGIHSGFLRAERGYRKDLASTYKKLHPSPVTVS